MNYGAHQSTPSFDMVTAICLKVLGPWFEDGHCTGQHTLKINNLFPDSKASVIPPNNSPNNIYSINMPLVDELEESLEVFHVSLTRMHVFGYWRRCCFMARQVAVEQICEPPPLCVAMTRLVEV